MILNKLLFILLYEEKQKEKNMYRCKNVKVNGRRTSIRLQEETWKLLADICLREKTTIHKICSVVDNNRGQLGLSPAVRLFILMYYRRELNESELMQYAFPRKNLHKIDI